MSMQVDKFPKVGGGYAKFPTTPSGGFGLDSADYESLLVKCLFDGEEQSVVAAGHLDGIITTGISTEMLNPKAGEKTSGERIADTSMPSAEQPKVTADIDMPEVIWQSDTVPICEKPIESMYKLKKKKKIKAKKKIQGGNRSWLAVDLQSLAFEFPRLPRRIAVHDESTQEMQMELLRFQEECMETSEEISSHKTEETREGNESVAPQSGDSTMDNTPKLSDMARMGNECVINFQPSEWDDVQYDRFWSHYTMEECFDEHLSAKDTRLLERIQFEMKANEPLRAKKKWRVMKAHRQVKSRHCFCVLNRPHGYKLHIHHRVYNNMVLNTTTRKPRPVSMKTIDRVKGVPSKHTKETHGEMKASSGKIPSARVVQYPVAQPAPPAAISAYNFDGDLDASLVNLLIQLQTRDLTPEDYDVLLQLDERVTPKTVSAETLQAFTTDTVTADSAGDVCAICMDVYEIGQVRKILPCEHVFHKQCIENWLRNAPSCPLDKESFD